MSVYNMHLHECFLCMDMLMIILFGYHMLENPVHEHTPWEPPVKVEGLGTYIYIYIGRRTSFAKSDREKTRKNYVMHCI